MGYVLSSGKQIFPKTVIYYLKKRIYRDMLFFWFFRECFFFLKLLYFPIDWPNAEFSYVFIFEWEKKVDPAFAIK